MGDPRADFFSICREELEKFGEDYAKKYGEDLGASLVFVRQSLVTFYDDLRAGPPTTTSSPPLAQPSSAISEVS
jgi:hypothetical protein